MTAVRSIWSVMMAAVLCGVVVPACGSAAHPAATATPAPGGAGLAAPHGTRFPHPAAITNRMFPLVPGTRLSYQGSIAEDGSVTRHSVVFTVTDLTKEVDGVQTVVIVDQDFLGGRLEEQELAFFAQDGKGNVWSFGEYPEEYEKGRFTGAPSTWVSGAAGGHGGLMMAARPAAGTQYLEGRVRAIDFWDVGRIVATSKATCVPAGCLRGILLIDEWSPNDPAGGHQLKYYAPGIGLVRVGARGGDSREYLQLASVRHLSGPELARARALAVTMDQRAYRVSKVYRATRPADRRQP